MRSKLKQITREEILYKSKLARERALKYFDISKWEQEHIKVFNSSLDKLNKHYN